MICRLSESERKRPTLTLETEYKGPVVFTRLEFAGRPVCVVRPG